MRLNHSSMIVFSGAVWLVIGVMLMFKGLNMLAFAAFFPGQPLKLLPAVQKIVSSPQQAALILICLALFIGFMKGRYVLAKTVRRVVGRILSLPSPVDLKDAYTGRYLALLAFMMALGMAMKWVPMAEDLRGFIDVSVGSALINGAILYFRKAIALKSQAL